MRLCSADLDSAVIDAATLFSIQEKITAEKVFEKDSFAVSPSGRYTPFRKGTAHSATVTACTAGEQSEQF